MYSMHIRSDWLHCGLRIRVLPYSRHDAQEWGAFGSDRNNPGDGASGMGFSLYGAERSSRAGSSGEAVLIAHLCVRGLQRRRVLFRFSQTAVVIELVDLPRASVCRGQS